MLNLVALRLRLLPCLLLLLLLLLLQRSFKALPAQLGQFHSADYIEFLAKVGSTSAAPQGSTHSVQQQDSTSTQAP